MLSAIWRKKKGSFEGTHSRGSDERSLRILEKFVGGNSNAVINMKPIFHLNEVVQSDQAGFSGEGHRYSNYCSLKFCHLCHKSLSLDKEVYMYRGDVGFCSVECRSRQMYLDEMKKIEISTRRILASFHQRRRNGGDRCELGDLGGVLPRRRHQFSSQSNHVIFS